MAPEPIRHRALSEPDRAEVQERIAHTVESDAQPFLDRYVRLEQSFGGRYISADLAAGNNTPVHNAAAVLASEQLRRVLAEPATSSSSGKDSPKPLGGRPQASHPSQTDELTQDLIGSMKRLSRDEQRRKKIAKKLF